MVTTIVKHRVANFEVFKRELDAGAEGRRARGWRRHTVLRDVHDPNLVTIIHRVESLHAVKELAGSEELRAAMQRAGVLGPPEVTFLEEADEVVY